MPYLGDLVTYQCTKCGTKHQKVLGSAIIFILDDNGDVKQHGSNIYLNPCDCKDPEFIVVSIGYTKNNVVPLWRDMSGTLHDPTTMSNDYKFNVFFMIWNHSVPTHMRAHLPPYIRYTKFSKCYTKTYMKTMFNVMREHLKSNVFGLTELQRGLYLFVEKWLASGQCEFMKPKETHV